MAVNIPSDLIVDVMRNADPARRASATARLQATSGAGDARFTQALNQLDFAAADREVLDARLTEPAGTAVGEERKASALKGFERMVLRNLFESLLPSAESGSFGSGPSAGVWRSMAAEQLANVYSDTGGLGMAAMLDGQRPDNAPRTDSQWPYFRLDAIEPFGRRS